MGRNPGEEPHGQQGPLTGRTQPGDILRDPRPVLLRPRRASTREQGTECLSLQGLKESDNRNPVVWGWGPGTERGSLVNNRCQCLLVGGDKRTVLTRGVNRGPGRGAQGSSALRADYAHNCKRVFKKWEGSTHFGDAASTRFLGPREAGPHMGHQGSLQAPLPVLPGWQDGVRADPSRGLLTSHWVRTRCPAATNRSPR